MGIKYADEADLQRKILKKLNDQRFHFKQVSQICDLVDPVKKIYVEVKPDFLAPAQILYGLAREGIKNAKYIGLATAFVIQFYKVPSFADITEFAREIDPSMKKPPSAIRKKKARERAFEMLGSPDVIYDYRGELDIEKVQRKIFIDDQNLEEFKSLFEKYKINPSDFIAWIMAAHAQGHKILVNKKGMIINVTTVEKFLNKTPKQTTIEGINYKPIKDHHDSTLLAAIRVRGNDATPIMHQLDRLEPTWSRRKLGRYFTRNEPQKAIQELVRGIKPDFIIEPYVGGGSLIEGLVGEYAGVGNDINQGFIKILKKKYEGYNWKFTALDTISTPSSELMKKWEIPTEGPILFLTNPPFGTVSTNPLASKQKVPEIRENKKSRKIAIEYGTVGGKYGKGDLVLPAIGKLIKMISARGNGYLAFFAPSAVFCKRYRYRKLFDALLKDFEFLEGYIFGGKEFNGVTVRNAVAFTVWRFHRGCNTVLESLVFDYQGENIRLKRMTLLKDGWRYDTRERVTGEIAVQGNDRFHVPAPKIFHLQVEKGGSELIQQNVKIELNLPIPSELAYGLWSIAVGRKAQIIDFPNYPLYIAGAYVHLPDFTREETMECLTYITIRALLFELENQYCEGKMGFIGADRVFKFGEQRLTKGAKYLIDTYGYCPIGDKTIKEVFEELRNEPDINNLPVSDYRAAIREEVAKRLEIIGYWDYIPIPQ